MTVLEEKALFIALRGPLEYQSCALNDVADELADADVKAITPAVDEIIRNAEGRGRFAQLLEIAYERERQAKEQKALPQLR